MRSKCFLYFTGVIDESLQEIVSNIKEQNDEKKFLEVNCLSFFSEKKVMDSMYRNFLSEKETLYCV